MSLVENPAQERLAGRPAGLAPQPGAGLSLCPGCRGRWGRSVCRRSGLCGDGPPGSSAGPALVCAVEYAAAWRPGCWWWSGRHGRIVIREPARRPRLYCR